MLIELAAADGALTPGADGTSGWTELGLVTTKDNKAYTGFISKSTADELEIRDIAGNVTTLKANAVKEKKELEISMMPPGLANALSIEEFASMITYLQSMKK